MLIGYLFYCSLLYNSTLGFIKEQTKQKAGSKYSRKDFLLKDLHSNQHTLIHVSEQ